MQAGFFQSQPKALTPVLVPRWYQQESVDATWDYLINDPSGSPVIVLPTGAGKSLCVAMLARDVLERFNRRVLIVAHRKELLTQNAEKVRALLPGKDIGIYSAGLNERDTEHDIICCGIQSVHKRAHEFGERKLVIVDECHLIPSDGEGMYRTFINDLRTINEGIRFVGLTATPFRTGEGRLTGKSQLFQKIVYSAPLTRLIDEGFLSQVTNQPATATVDTSKLHIRAGEFIASEVESLFNSNAHVEAACQELVALSADRKSILVFCSGVNHAEHVKKIIEELTGDEVGIVTGQSGALERAATLRRFKERDLRWTVNVDVLCLDEKTEILTDRGWCGIDEISPDHLIAAWETDNSIVFTPPKTIVRRNRSKSEKMVSLKTNGVDIRVTSNHRMVYQKNKGTQFKSWDITSAENLVGKAVCLPCCGNAVPIDVAPFIEAVPKKTRAARVRSLAYVIRKRSGSSFEDSATAAARQIDEKAGMVFSKPSELTMNECWLIGFWLGDGTKSNGRLSLSQSEVYGDIVKKVDAALKEAGINHHRQRYAPARKTKNHSIRWTLSRGTGGHGQKVDGYYRLEPYFEKTGTPLFWGLSREQLLSLLDGLWQADGLHHAKNPLKIIAATSKALFDLLQAICVCRGIKSNISKCSAPRKSNHKQQWKFSWSVKRETVHVYKNRFELESEYVNERVWCVTSSTGKLITRRNGKAAVVGNTTGFDAPNIDCVAVLRATLSPGLFAQMVGRALRTHPSKTDALILDFGENLKRHGPIDSPTFGMESQKSGTGTGEAVVKICPACRADVFAGSRECECGFVFPPRDDGRHDGKSDQETALLASQMKPSDWYVVSCIWGLHRKRQAGDEAPPTLRISYTCQPNEVHPDTQIVPMDRHSSECSSTKGIAKLRPDTPHYAELRCHDCGGFIKWLSKSSECFQGGDLSTEIISEWVCLQHEGFARTKAIGWWLQHSKAPVPSTIAEAVSLLNRGAAAMPTHIRAKREGKFWKILSQTIDELPDEWEDEPEKTFDTEPIDEFDRETDEVPF